MYVTVQICGLGHVRLEPCVESTLKLIKLSVVTDPWRGSPLASTSGLGRDRLFPMNALWYAEPADLLWGFFPGSRTAPRLWMALVSHIPKVRGPNFPVERNTQNIDVMSVKNRSPKTVDL